MTKKKDNVAAEGGPVLSGPAETKQQRFVRLAQKRVPKALKAITAIRRLTTRSNYEWTADQAARITDALATAVNGVIEGFADLPRSDETFTL